MASRGGDVDPGGRQAGPQQPEKYPYVGPNYRTWGEQPGMIYMYNVDRYYTDPNQFKNTYQQQGLIPKEKEPPSLFESAAPLAIGGAALIGGQELGREIPAVLKDVGGSAKGLLGLGKTTTAATAPTTGAVSGVGPVASGAEYASAVQGGQGLFSLSGIGSSGNAILPAAGALGAYDLLTNDYGEGRGALQGAASGAAIGSYFGLPGAAIGAGVGGLIGLGKGLMDKESTLDTQKKHWKKLAESADPATAAFAEQYRQYLTSDRAKQDRKGPGFDDLRESGQLTPEHVWGAYGLFKTFGSDWLNRFSEEQRREIARRGIAQGLFDSKRGDIEITDENAIRQIAQDVVSGASASIPAQAPIPPGAAPPPTILGQPAGQQPGAYPTPPPATFQPPGAFQSPIQNLKPYQPGDPPGSYRSADGVNVEGRDENGNITSTTLVGVAPPGTKISDFQGRFAAGRR